MCGFGFAAEPLLTHRTGTDSAATNGGGANGSAGNGSAAVRVSGGGDESDPLVLKTSPIHEPPQREFNVVAFYFVICMVGFVQGSSNLAKLATEYFFKDDVHFEPAELAIASGLISSPWVIKPVYGFISDSYPILKRRRSPYFFIFGLTGFGFYMIMAFLVHQAVRMFHFVSYLCACVLAHVLLMLY